MNTVRREVVLKAMVAWMVVVVAATPGYAQTQQERDAETRDRQQFVIFMGELRQAVTNGASVMLGQVRQVSSKAELALAGAPDVEGYRLEDMGLLFRVRVPDMRPLNRWALQLFAGEQPQQPQPRRQTATVTPTGLAPASNAGAPPSVLVPPAAPYVDPDLAFDPDAVYTREVKTFLVNAMLQRSRELRIAPGQYLIVVARAPGEPDLRYPSSYSKFNTMYFRIKGADLAAFHEGKATLEQAQKAVSVRED